VTVLAAVLAGSTNSTSTINNVEPGLLGFLVVAALGVAVFFLLRSMNKQFKKIGPRPEEPEETDAATADEAHGGDSGSGAAGSTAGPALKDARHPRPRGQR
jgi:hypothetical protein